MSFARDVATFELKGPFGRRVAGVSGGRGIVTNTDKLLQTLAIVDKAKGTTSQVFDASQVAGAEHLVHATRLALIAHSIKHNFASSLGVELACWVAAERQIRRAFKKVGVREGKMELAFVVIGTSHTQVKATMTQIFSELAMERDDKVLELRRDKFSTIQQTFSISSKELGVAPLQKLILERIALLALAR